MTKPWKGKIAVDIRDAVPDWTPYPANGSGRCSEYPDDCLG